MSEDKHLLHIMYWF